MRHFFEELRKLENQLCGMAATVRGSIHRSVLCLTEKNAEYAEQVLRDEALVNQAEVAIDDFAIRLTSLHQPVASDMRLLISALKINTDLERMGDLAVNIARRALTLIQTEAPQPPVPIPLISNLVENMVDSCITAFTSRDAELARSVLLADDEVDSLRSQIYEDLTARMEADAKVVRSALALIFIARNLERIADHATNIAEDVIFLVRGIDVRHHNEA
jgi:phosphate transport system protein